MPIMNYVKLWEHWDGQNPPEDPPYQEGKAPKDRWDVLAYSNSDEVALVTKKGGPLVLFGYAGLSKSDFEEYADREIENWGRDEDGDVDVDYGDFEIDDQCISGYVGDNISKKGIDKGYDSWEDGSEFVELDAEVWDRIKSDKYVSDKIKKAIESKMGKTTESRVRSWTSFLNEETKTKTKKATLVKQEKGRIPSEFVTMVEDLIEISSRYETLEAELKKLKIQMDSKEHDVLNEMTEKMNARQLAFRAVVDGVERGIKLGVDTSNGRKSTSYKEALDDVKMELVPKAQRELGLVEKIIERHTKIGDGKTQLAYAIEESKVGDAISRFGKWLVSTYEKLKGYFSDTDAALKSTMNALGVKAVVEQLEWTDRQYDEMFNELGVRHDSKPSKADMKKLVAAAKKMAEDKALDMQDIREIFSDVMCVEIHEKLNIMNDKKQSQMWAGLEEVWSENVILGDVPRADAIDIVKAFAEEISHLKKG